MKLKALQTLFLSAAAASVAHAQEACPSPDLLLGPAISAEDYFTAMSGPAITKGEFETSAEFEARTAAVQRPAASLVVIDTSPENFKYDADSEAFQFRIYNLETSGLYRTSYTLAGTTPNFGGYNYGDPVDLKLKRIDTRRGEYLATNAYGAETSVREVESVEYLIFDNKGRKKMTTTDDLFSERKSFEMTNLSIPVPRADAQAVKEGLMMVAYVVGREPWTIESTTRSKPTRDVPIDLRMSFRIAFADIQCVGVRNAESELIAHWATR